MVLDIKDVLKVDHKSGVLIEKRIDYTEKLPFP